MKKLLILTSFVCLSSLAEPLSAPLPDIDIELVQAKVDEKWALFEYVAAMRLLKACRENERDVKLMESGALKKAASHGASNEVIEQIKKNHEKHMPDCNAFLDKAAKAKENFDAASDKVNQLSSKNNQ